MEKVEFVRLKSYMSSQISQLRIGLGLVKTSTQKEGLMKTLNELIKARTDLIENFNIATLQQLKSRSENLLTEIGKDTKNLFSNSNEIVPLKNILNDTLINSKRKKRSKSK
jgi:hypothetical protein